MAHCLATLSGWVAVKLVALACVHKGCEDIVGASVEALRIVVGPDERVVWRLAGRCKEAAEG